MNLTIHIPEETQQALEARATARGVSAEQYVLEVLAQDLARDDIHQSPQLFNNLSDLLLASPFAGADLDLSRSR